MLGSIFSSSRSALSAEQTLNLVNAYLKTARETPDIHIASILCDDAEISLSQAKKSFKRALTPETLADQTLRNKIGMAYFERGELLKKIGNHDKAEASYKKAEKWGYVQEPDKSTSASRPSNTFSSIHSALLPRAALLVASQHASPAANKGSLGTNIAQLPPHIFAQNVSAPVARYDLPQADDPLTSTPQLVYCLSLLPGDLLADKVLNQKEKDWSQAIAKDEIEQKRLRTLATDVIREFTTDELQEATAVTEVVCLAPVLEQAYFKELIAQFVDGIDKQRLLDFALLEGLAELIQHTTSGDLTEDDLIKILGLLDTRLESTHGQSTEAIYQLTRTVSHVLDAMADSQVKGVKREALHDPLSAYLKGLKSSADPYLVYQAAYASQALLYVPNNEKLLDTVMRIGGKMFGGAASIVKAVKGFDLNGFVEGLKSIQEGFDGVVAAAKTLKEGYDTVMSLKESGQSFLDSLQEGYNFDRKSAWYPALQIADQLIQKGRLADFKELVCAAPCRRDPVFQWGVCERLGQLAANPLWEANTRQSALDFLGTLYKEDATWGYHANVKQWIIKILMHLADAPERAVATDVKASTKPFEIAPAAKTLLEALAKNGDAQKQALYAECIKEGKGRCPYTNVGAPLLASPSLLERAQNKPDVETDLRKLKRQRLKEQGNAVYIAPQAKPSLKASDETLFNLTEAVQAFLQSEQKVMLLLGDSGSGKSTFNRMLEKDLWHAYTEEKGQRIPLFITLPAIDKPEQDLIPKQLRKLGFTEPQIRELKDTREFIVICDGYDESQQTHNLYMSNQLQRGQKGAWSAQMVISCRSEYLGLDYRDRFQPMDQHHQAESSLFQKAVLTPFSDAQITEYVKKYVSLHKPLWKTKSYDDALNQIPHLKELVKNPFLLTLSLEVLPRLVLDPKQDLSTARITRVALYDEFVEQWLERGKKRLGEKDLSRQEKKAFESLADEGFTQNGIDFLKNLSAAIYEEQGGNPVVEYSHFKDQKTWKEAFFSRDDDKYLLREASPLSRSGNQFRFIHRSLLEYGVARAVFDPQDGERARKAVLTQALTTRRGSASSVWSFRSQTAVADDAVAIEQPLLASPLAKKDFVSEPSVLQFLAERVQQEPLFKEQLHAVIERSKTDKSVRRAAANAITILVRAGVQFHGADLKGIQIPGADLSGGVFDSAQLQVADLRKVKLQNSWLRQTNLSGAQMAGVQFGEWPYLQEESGVRSCAYAPDGKVCAIGLGDVIRVYDTSSWENIHTLRGHRGDVNSVVYSPSGAQIASGSDDKTVRLWDARSGAPGHTLEGHTDAVNSVAYSPSNAQLASGSDDKTVRLWDAHSGAAEHTLEGHADVVNSVVYSPNSAQIASGSDDQTVRLWDAQSGAPGHILEGHTGWVKSVVYSPNGAQIASASSDNTVRLWDAHSGAPGHILQGHTSYVWSVVYSPSGAQIASGSWDNTVRLWDTQSGAPGHTLEGHTREVTSLVYAPSGTQIASGSGDKTVRLWDAQSGTPGYTLEGHTDVVSSVVYSPSGTQIASGSDDKTVRLWDAQNGIPGHTLKGHLSAVMSVAYAPNGAQLASGSYDKTVRLWDAQSGAPGHTLQGHADAVYSVVYAPSGAQLASSSHDQTVRLWDAESGAAEHTLEGHTGWVKSVVYSPNGAQIASASSDNTVRLWDAHSGAPGHILQGHTDAVYSVAYSPSEAQIASGSRDKTVRLWDAQSGAAGHTLEGHADVVNSVVYSPSGAQIASGSDDQTVRLWDVASGQCRAVIEGFDGSILSLAWKTTPDSTYLVTGSIDRLVCQWQVIEEEDEIQVRLSWISPHGELNVKNTLLEGVRGLSKMNTALLKQRGAVGEPTPLLDFQQASQQLSVVSAAAAKFKQLPKRKALDALPVVQPAEQSVSPVPSLNISQFA